MKKIISILFLIIFLSSNFSFAEECLDGNTCEEGTTCGACEEVTDEASLKPTKYRICGECIPTEDPLDDVANAVSDAADAAADAA